MPNKAKNLFSLHGPFEEVPTEVPIVDGKWHTGSMLPLDAYEFLPMKGKPFEEEAAEWRLAHISMVKPKLHRMRRPRKKASKWSRFKKWLVS